MKDYTPEQLTIARNKLTDLCAAFGADSPSVDSEGKALFLIADDRLKYDAEAEKATYLFSKPIVLKNGEAFDEVSFREPTQADLEFAHKGLKVSYESGVGSLDRGDLDLMFARMLIKIGSSPKYPAIPSTIIDRLPLREVSALQEVFKLLGFLE